MGARICASESNLSVIKLRKVKLDELENNKTNFNINGQENIIQNFTYEEYHFDITNNNYTANANNKEGEEENNKDDSEQIEEHQSEKNEEMNNVFANQYDSSEVRSKRNSNIVNSNNHIEEINADSKLIQESKDNTQLQDPPENYSKENYNSSCLPEQDQEDQHNQLPPKELTSFLPNIFSFIPEKVLKSQDKGELLFVSDLKKMINCHNKERIKYSDRFCMITKDHFVLYSTKENYITLKRPLGVLPIDLITRVVLFKLNKNQKVYDHFYICFSKAEATSLLLNQINTFFMNTSSQQMTSKETSDNNNGQLANADEALLMFCSSSVDIIKKWYVVLTHLMKEKKNKENTLVD